MYDKLEKNDSLVSWMIAGGARLDEPDPRHLAHLMALRDAKRESHGAPSPFAWLTSLFRPTTIPATATGPATSTTCCAAA
jgi:hypothetical protein